MTTRSVTRDSITIPGYDCIYGPCSPPCPGFLGMNDGHGIHGEEWYYGIAAPDFSTALTLTVYTDIYPATVPEDHVKRCGVRCYDCRHDAHEKAPCECGCPPRPDRREGMDITLHVRGAARNRALPIFGRDFTCVDDAYTSALDAAPIWRAHGDPERFEQAESFWKALEARWQERHELYLKDGQRRAAEGKR